MLLRSSITIVLAGLMHSYQALMAQTYVTKVCNLSSINALSKSIPYECEEKFRQMPVYQIKVQKGGAWQCLTQNIQLDAYDVQPGMFVSIPKYLEIDPLNPLVTWTEEEKDTHVQVQFDGGLTLMKLENCQRNNLNQYFVPYLAEGERLISNTNLLLVLANAHNRQWFAYGPYYKPTLEVSEKVLEGAKNGSFKLRVYSTYKIKDESATQLSFSLEKMGEIGDFSTIVD